MSKEGWARTTPPWRPYVFEIIIYFFYALLSKLFFKKVLIVGSTYEIRKIFSFLKKEYDLIDYSDNMIEINTPPRDSVKKIYMMPWDGLNSLSGKYDLVIGDLIFNLMANDEFKNFSKNVNELLVKSGLLLVRIRMLTEEPIEKIIPRLEKRLAYLKVYDLYANLQTINMFKNNFLNNFIQKYTYTNNVNIKNKLQIVNYFSKRELNYFLRGEKDTLDYFTNWEIKKIANITYVDLFDTFSIYRFRKL